MKNSQYFRQAEINANERYFSANADDEEELFSDDEWQGAGGLEDEWAGASNDPWGYFDDPYANASGRNVESQSQPYIVRIANSTSSAVSNVIVLDSYTNMADTNNFGNPVAIALTINNPNTTYRQFLRQIASQPFEVGELYLNSTTTAQVVETITVRHSDSTGTRLDKLLIPLRDPYQYQNGSIVHRYRHMVDGFTRYTVNSILASATLDIYIFPVTKINAARVVQGKPAVVSYGDPGTVRTPRVMLPGRPPKRGRPLPGGLRRVR